VPSFTERYHQLTKYHPDTIDKLGGVQPSQQPEPFKDAHPGRRIDLIPHLQPLFGAADQPPDPALPWLRDEALPALARLLHFTLGLTARLSGGAGHDLFLRAAPSAGGLYPTEAYVAVRGFSDLPSGLYHYHSLRSALIPVWEGDFFADLRHHFLDHPAAAEARCLFLFTGMYARSAWRYKERAYRRILLDTGHAAANLVEIAGALGLDTDLLGSFYDEGLEELLFLERREEFPLLGVALRPRPAHPGTHAQRPGAVPGEAVTHAVPGDSMQAQQNACERIYPGHPLRPYAAEPEPAPPFDAGSFNPQSVILNRRSTRRFNGGSIQLKDAEDMLRFAFRPAGGGRAPSLLSAGVLGLHLVVFSVEGLAPGVYALDPRTLERALVREGDFRSDLLAISLGQEIASDSAFAIVYTADMEKLVSVYGDRGYRYACLDCGLIGERVQLWAVHRELGSSGIGGYYDDLANELLELPLAHGVLYLTVVGVPED
jgi:SagB-type dehydrogenase family enzyme